MEDIETFKWSPANQVSPNLPSEEKIGCIQKKISTTVKQKLPADQSEFASDFGVAKQKKALQTKVLPGDGGENLNSGDLPPGLVNDILTLREDFPLEDIDRGIKKDIQRKQNKRNHHSETSQISFSENAANVETVQIDVDNALEVVKLYDDSSKDFSIRKEESNHSCGYNSRNEGSNDFSIQSSRKLPTGEESPLNDKGNASVLEGSASPHEGSASFHKGRSSFPEGSASPDKDSIGQLQGPAKLTVNARLEKHFESKGKYLCPLNLHTGNSSTITISELRQAAQYHGCTNDILLLYKSDPPNTNEPHTQSCSSQRGDTFGQWKLAEPDGLGKLAKQGHRFIGTTVSQQLSFDSPDLSNVKIAHTHQVGKAFSQSPVTFSQNRVYQSHFGGSVSGLANWKIPGIRNDLPMANQNICKQLSPDISAQPVPPDITQYTCSEELKHALQMKFLPFKDRGQAGPNNQIDGGATSDHRYHPYSRPEATSTTQFQTSLPKLPEFIEKNSKKK